MKGWLLLLALVGIDFITKKMAIGLIPPLEFSGYPFGGIAIFNFGGVAFSLNYIVNTGAAWGLFAGHAGLLFAIRSAIIGVVALFVKKSWPIWVVLAGAVGNGIDYLLYGHVVDFLHFNFWGYSFPIFNIADSCVTIGAFSLLIWSKGAQKLQSL